VQLKFRKNISRLYEERGDVSLNLLYGIIIIIIMSSLIQLRFVLATNALLNVGISRECFQSIAEGSH